MKDKQKEQENKEEYDRGCGYCGEEWHDKDWPHWECPGCGGV